MIVIKLEQYKNENENVNTNNNNLEGTNNNQDNNVTGKIEIKENKESENKKEDEKYDIKNDKEFKYMNYENQTNNENNNESPKENSFFEIYKHYIKYNEIILYTFLNKDDFNNKYLKYSLFDFYIECIILFNIIIFPNKIFSKIYQKKKYSFFECLINNIFITLICIIIIFCFKFLIGTQHNILNKFYYIIETKETEGNHLESQNNLEDNNNKEYDLNGYKKEKLINDEIKNKKILIFIYFIIVSVVFFYSFIHGISFGINFFYTQKYVLINMVICFVMEIIISLILNLISCFMRYFGIKNYSKKLFNSSFWIIL